MAKLYIFTKKGRLEYQLVDHNVIGRHPKNRIKIFEGGISKVHCLIASEDQRTFSVRDLGSRNGTFVNGARIKGKKRLRDGDELRIGTTRCLFRERAANGQVIWLEEDRASVAKRILHKISPDQMNKFFPAGNIIDDEMLRADYERLRMSYLLQRDIGFDLHVDFILGRVLDRTFEILPFDQGVILLMDQKGELRLQAHKTPRLADTLTITRSLADLVCDEGQGVMLMTPNPSADPEAPGFVETPVQATLAMPIMDEHELHGLMVLDRWAAYHPFREVDLCLLATVANQAAVFIRNAQVAKNVTRESLTRDRFRKLLSPEMAEMVVAGQTRVNPDGSRRQATVLMANIIGFGSLTAGMDAESLIEFLNHHFEYLVEAVFRRDGMIDKFMGDRLLAVWGIPDARADDSLRAVAAAVEMQRLMEAVNRDRAGKEFPPVEIGIGVATGPVVAGSMGSRKTRRYSVIGDVVGDAQAICASARGEQVLISEALFKLVRRQFDIDEAHTLQIGNRSVKCFEIIGQQEERPQQPWSYLG